MALRSMPTRRSSARVVAVALLLTMTGCSLLSDDRDPDVDQPAGAGASPSGVTITDAPPDVLQGLESTLGRRAAAVRDGDERAFLAGLAKGDAALRDQQRTYFANLRQLPLAVFDYSLDPADLVRDGDDYWIVVNLALQLDGFDDEPVVSRDRFRFTPGDQPGRFRLASVTDLQWEVENAGQPQPWDDGEVVVTRADGVLGIFDAGSVRASDKLLASVQRGITDVAGVVPSSWSQSVVVYAFSNTAFLATLPGLPGGDPTSVDGVAFPVFAAAGREGGGRLVATRFVLHPRMLDEEGRARDRLVRHELTHVAIGEGDDRAPVWLSEGLAEWVSVQRLPPEKRTISEAAIEAARAGVVEMPADAHVQRAGRGPGLGQLRHRVVRVPVPRRQLRRGNALAAAGRTRRAGRRRSLRVGSVTAVACRVPTRSPTTLPATGGRQPRRRRATRRSHPVATGPVSWAEPGPPVPSPA